MLRHATTCCPGQEQTAAVSGEERRDGPAQKSRPGREQDDPNCRETAIAVTKSRVFCFPIATLYIAKFLLESSEFPYNIKSSLKGKNKYDINSYGVNQFRHRNGCRFRSKGN